MFSGRLGARALILEVFLADNLSILVTGGSGSFGRAFVKAALTRVVNLERLVIFSRDEQKHFEMEQEFRTNEHPQLRYFIGDIRDKQRVLQALEGIDLVVHAAALKHVPYAEYNPFEYIKTNVIGSQNLIEACFQAKVKNLIALSTDKAAAPVNLYGATKLCSDKLFISANNIKGERDIKFSVVRYGNVMGSRGSVIPFFLKHKTLGTIPITHPEMTRFNITISDAVDMVFWTIENAVGGEIFVPKIPSYKIMDLAKAIGPNCEYTIIGIRPGEKIHEEMITTSDSLNTFDLGKYYAITPGFGQEDHYTDFPRYEFKKVDPGFSYNSGNNKFFLTVEEIRSLIGEHLGVPLP